MRYLVDWKQMPARMIEMDTITVYCGWHRQNFGMDKIMKDGDTPYEQSSHGICNECQIEERMKINHAVAA